MPARSRWKRRADRFWAPLRGSEAAGEPGVFGALRQTVGLCSGALGARASERRAIGAEIAQLALEFLRQFLARIGDDFSPRLRPASLKPWCCAFWRCAGKLRSRRLAGGSPKGFSIGCGLAGRRQFWWCAFGLSYDVSNLPSSYAERRRKIFMNKQLIHSSKTIDFVGAFKRHAWCGGYVLNA